MSFNTEAKVDGFNATEFLNDPALGESYVDAMAATLNVTADSILIINVTDADEVDEDRRFLSVSRELLSSATLVETQITVILEQLGKKSTEGLEDFDTLSKSVSSSVSSGSFGQKLQAAALERGVAKPVAMDMTFQVVAKKPVIVQQRTASPTTTPTLFPTLTPTGRDADDGIGFSLLGLNTADSIGALVGIILGCFVIGAIAVYVVTHKSAGKAAVVAPGAGALTGVIDPVLAKTKVHVAIV